MPRDEVVEGITVAVERPAHQDLVRRIVDPVGDRGGKGRSGMSHESFPLTPTLDRW
jgi:hypothetical protein